MTSFTTPLPPGCCTDAGLQKRRHLPRRAHPSGFRYRLRGGFLRCLSPGQRCHCNVHGPRRTGTGKPGPVCAGAGGASPGGGPWGTQRLPFPSKAFDLAQLLALPHRLDPSEGAVLYSTVLYSTLLFCTALCSTILFSSALYCAVLSVQELCFADHSPSFPPPYNVSRAAPRELLGAVCSPTILPLPLTPPRPSPTLFPSPAEWRAPAGD